MHYKINDRSVKIKISFIEKQEKGNKFLPVNVILSLTAAKYHMIVRHIAFFLIDLSNSLLFD